MQKFIILIYFFCFSLSSADFCVIYNILVKREKIVNCFDKQLLFGYIEFKSKQNNLKYSFNKELKEYVPHSYKSEVLSFVKNNCYKESLKIKTITNLNNIPDEYEHKIVIECRFKS